jgi:hypothetical protein
MVRGAQIYTDSANDITRDADLQKHKEQTEVMKVLLSKYKKMELLLDSYEQTHSTMEEQAR